MWNVLFERFSPLEIEPMMRTHFRLLSVWMEQPGEAQE
jgi:hypothetical protein